MQLLLSLVTMKRTNPLYSSKVYNTTHQWFANCVLCVYLATVLTNYVNVVFAIQDHPLRHSHTQLVLLPHH